MFGVQQIEFELYMIHGNLVHTLFYPGISPATDTLNLMFSMATVMMGAYV